MNASTDISAHAIVGDAAPDYTFSFEPYPHRVRAVVNGINIADSDRVMVLEETRLPPVFYFPREHVRMDLMRPTRHRTHCPFKGNASYWSLEAGDTRLLNIMWSYEEPVAEARAIAGYVAFYGDLIDEWFEDEQPVGLRAKARDHYTNPLLAWLIREAPAIGSPTALSLAFANLLVDAGIPVWRTNIVIRTLHPQVMAVSYRWWRKTNEVEELRVGYGLMQEAKFQASPLMPLFQGAGGIRRRLDVVDPELDYPILEDLYNEGGTDYVAMPMVFSDGQINAVTLASARPGGFSTSDLGHIYEILDVLGRLYEVHALRHRATTLLDTYLGNHAGTRVLDGLIKRGDGEDIDAVIWFCDLRESTPLAQSMGRTEFLALLNSYFDCMAGAVLEHGGQVLRFIGDAALAIFPLGNEGIPSRDVPSAYRQALTAALAARERMAALNAGRADAGLSRLRYGLALHPGEVTYGNIGTESRLEFTVIGDAANRAARIESMCKTLDRNVLVSAEFARHFPDRFESLGHHALRGVEDELELFALRR